MTGPGQQSDESPNGPAEENFLCRLRNIVEVARLERELSGLEVMGALVVVFLDVYDSMPKESDETDDED